MKKPQAVAMTTFAKTKAIKAKTAITSVLVTGMALATSAAHAALDPVKVTAVETEVLADVATAAGSGMTVLGTVLATSVGMSLLSRFINKGANG
ncbi:hypothetical protein [Pseudoalteromonas sp. T1lg48]|uniref:hypothetical protein n=1 Tax=Pseudoalteromonas sp. T1lg48 TaxID=2077100 RepID=UPI000CF6938A|nr:hypothetical protein [Pseudoalteromonas sp. T1lg48]